MIFVKMENKFPVIKLRIRDLREDNDLTQKAVALYLHCDQSLYSKYERMEREIPLHLLARLAVLYETSLDYLAGLTDERLLVKRDKGKNKNRNIEAKNL